MEENHDLDKLREAVLDDIDRTKKKYRMAILLCALTEGFLIILYLSVMDGRNVLHWLIFIAASLAYWTLGAGLLALGIYNNLNTQRIINAIYSSKNED